MRLYGQITLGPEVEPRMWGADADFESLMHQDCMFARIVNFPMEFCGVESKNRAPVTIIGPIGSTFRFAMGSLQTYSKTSSFKAFLHTNLGLTELGIFLNLQTTSWW